MTPARDDDVILGKAYDAALARRIWTFVRPHWRWLALSLVIMPATIALELAQPWLLKIAIDRHIAVGNPDGLAGIAALYVALVAGNSLLGYVELYALQIAGQRATSDLRVAVHRHVLSLRSAYFDRTPVGRLVTRVTGDTENIQEMFASGVIAIIADVVKLAAIIVMLLVLNVRLTLLSFLALPALFVIVEVFRRIMRSSFRELRRKQAALNAFAQEHVGGVKVVQLFGRERDVARRFGKINREYREAYFRGLKADASLYAIVEMVGSLSLAGIVWYGGSRIAAGALTFGLVVAFIEYVHKFFVPVRDLSAKYAVMQAAMASAERVFTLLDTDEPDAPASAASPPSGTAALALERVTFAYRPGEPVLEDVSVEVARGETVAVVGATGAGKSTLVKLLCRLYEPAAGVVRVGGEDVRAIPRDALRRRVTVIPQDVFLFAGTIGDNLRMGLPAGADVDEAVRRVGADRALRRRGADLAAPVAERGANFSAGERQLLAFARALARRPEILVLDEATAQVDPEAESWIEEGLAALMRGRTSLVIAHRLSTIRRADRIVVLHAGRVAEVGTHSDLLARNGRYARLHELQLVR